MARRPGEDRIDGGSGTDQLTGGPGDDSINAIDGKRDTVDCGPGRVDTARVDPVDRVKNCERVLVAKPKKKR
jgi:Ca2+-binding RTX toxin-like protein